ncbi:MAG TPA: hypothetical protein VFA76_04945 [Terriglobales bacterium]|jgi:hypothetical protein|nr:hypothetical protein [Terriglobales bacterium]
MASKKVILYFESPSDALKFTLAAGSVMAGDIHDASDGLIHEMQRASRIQLGVTATADGPPLNDVAP